MNRKFFTQIMLLLAFSATAFASDLRGQLREATEGMQYENCAQNMGGISKILDNLKLEDYQNEIKSTGHDALLNELFSFKITIHNKLRAFHADKGISKDCSIATRHAFRAIRTTEDYVGDHYFRTYGESIKFPDNSFEPGNVHVRRNPEFIGFDLMKDLRSGDIILSRGNAFTSAAIASLGEFDTQFSHMSIVYQKENGEYWTVEAHIEVGSFVRPLQDHINDKNHRSMIYRYDDAETAKKAAEYIFHKVEKASNTTGNILYDFAFNQENSDSLFCSEVISHAFDHVTNGAVQIPLFRSRLMDRKPEFVKMLAIEAEESFVPSDIEVDPRFKVISEWRNSATTLDNIQKDSVLQTMYFWNDELNYQMIQGSSKTSFLYRNVAWPLRRVPFLKKYFIKKLPLNMSRKLIGYFGVLESTGELLQKNLQIHDQKAISERGFPLLKSEKFEINEAFRIEDLQSKKKKLHKMYRPKKGKS